MSGAAATVPAVLALAGVRVAYEGRAALEVPRLEVREGEVLAVIGPNGSGKSTLLRLLGLLERPSAGEVRFRDRPLSPEGALAERRRMATVFQRPLLADMSVADNVALGLRFRGVAGEAREARVARWLGRFAIAALAGRRAHTLSGGEAQRAALARALVLEPEVLLLDEPFAGLDQPTRSALLGELGAILRADRVTTVVVTHDRGEAQALADRVAVLMAGRLQQLDETARVFQAPVSEEVARFVGVETIVPGDVIGHGEGVTLVQAAGRTLEVAAPAAAGARVRVCIRPEDVTLVRPPAPPAPSSAGNHLAGTVVGMTPASGQVRVLVDVGFTLVATVTPRAIEALGLAPGAPVVATFTAAAPHLLPAAASVPWSAGGESRSC